MILVTTIYCTNSQGSLVPIPVAELTFSLAVYGVLIENSRVLLQQHPGTGLWHPPGGILCNGQTPERGVRAFFRAATGFLPDLTSLLFLEEQHRLDERGQPWHLSVFYYGLQRSVGGAVGLAGVPDSQRPEWVPVHSLTRTEMQFGYPAVMAAARRKRA